TRSLAFVSPRRKVEESSSVAEHGLHIDIDYVERGRPALTFGVASDLNCSFVHNSGPAVGLRRKPSRRQGGSPPRALQPCNLDGRLSIPGPLVRTKRLSRHGIRYNGAEVRRIESWSCS